MMSFISTVSRKAQKFPLNYNSQQFQTQIRNRSNRSRRGLYDGKDIRTGNNVPFSLKKTKRTFKPNVFKKRLYSEILDEMIQFHVTTSALRSIDKAGGLDQYLLEDGMSRGLIQPGNNEGWNTRQKLLQRLAVCEEKGLNPLQDIVFTDEDGQVKKDVNLGVTE
ncbi:hypothetical protein CTEN210_10994 [Chaetoceros tenuissimus]|uniref:Large ribosomal subunit protein bL28m n=1 Tax=Chaetoceros tenuissimus TaxID=426638 RepID=A0AAD3CYG6_9STRA|nr:hypothetical protein CTEN210_10994 [Chaetoceros tenuissimus]